MRNRKLCVDYSRFFNTSIRQMLHNGDFSFYLATLLKESDQYQKMTEMPQKEEDRVASSAVGFNSMSPRL